ncbi:sugar transferase [Allostreptomyces psammosilenae]|uniref:Lipopolysaccharide/colanic/teichoic acid biosynthesis glycosyltransferase n=1 Tax=Allostreptomyces psammosilenae TaxID=1892865 RepID=A0A853AAS4_9ACTN|nr:sugar transferase [Allostreptomyces psammosilenae]NYI07472.1 lipopolysaccharide/colanic/teichoic acid biosynthesis glycosyltransferase [Allostreptomyces psammosilenae]
MRRGGDIVVAALAGIALAPLIVAVALLVRITMGGPVVFHQTRVGRYGRTFRIHKFRTMRDARHPGESDADRLTPLGRLLRASSIDELPQLWNVLRGEMAIVGPRPTLPEQVMHYTPRQRGRLLVRPGLTGWAQIRGRNALSWPERIELDLEYVRDRSLRLDLRIMLRTVGVLLRPVGITGAGGVNPGFPIPGTDRTTPAATVAPSAPVAPGAHEAARGRPAPEPTEPRAA